MTFLKNFKAYTAFSSIIILLVCITYFNARRINKKSALVSNKLSRFLVRVDPSQYKSKFDVRNNEYKNTEIFKIRGLNFSPTSFQSNEKFWKKFQTIDFKIFGEKINVTWQYSSIDDGLVSYLGYIFLEGTNIYDGKIEMSIFRGYVNGSIKKHNFYVEFIPIEEGVFAAVQKDEPEFTCGFGQTNNEDYSDDQKTHEDYTNEQNIQENLNQNSIDGLNSSNSIEINLELNQLNSIDKNTLNGPIDKNSKIKK